MKTIIILPYGSVLELEDVVSFDFNPPPGDDLDVPPGYVKFRNGGTTILLPGDAWVLRDWFVNCEQFVYGTWIKLGHSVKFEERLKAAEARNKRLAEAKEKK